MDKKKNITREYIIKSEDRKIHCRLFRKRCKRLCIAVTPDLTVNITAPLRASDSFIRESVDKKIPWIFKTIQRLKKCHSLPLPEKYESGERLAYLGSEYILRVLSGKRKTARLFDDMLVVQLPVPDRKGVKRAVERWFRLRAEETFEDYLEAGYRLISQHCVTKPVLKIRRMRSRWGSCGRSGQITLNLSLIHFPPVCIQYIIMHELCHLKHLNHSKEYYQFLQHCMPDWKERKTILESYRLSV